jgi:hypothetical protein
MFGNRLKVMAALAVVLLAASCSQIPNAEPKADAGSGKPAAPAGPVSGKTAFWEMYKSAHTWAADLTPLALESRAVPGAKNDSGKAEGWTATFGSPRKHEARTFFYSVSAHAPDVAKGVTVGHALPWGGPTHDALPFDISEFVVDSDAAYQTALAQGTPWLKKHPDKEASMTLGNASRFNGPVWYVQWGDKKTGYAVFVSARSGTVVK